MLEIQPFISWRGYPAIKLNNKQQRIHKLVMLAFVGETPKGFEINHKNGIKTDNRLSNLEFVTHSYNVAHAYRLGLNENVRRASSLAMKRKHRLGLVNYAIGARHPFSKLDAVKVRKIRKMFKLGLGDTHIGRVFGVRRESIRQIRQGKTWRHVV